MLHTRTGARELALLLQRLDISLQLADRQMLSVIDAQGIQLRAMRGTLWVTLDGDPADHILGPGDSLVVRRRGRTLVTAMNGPATLTASRSAEPTWSALWRNLRARLTHGALAARPSRPRNLVHE